MVSSAVAQATEAFVGGAFDEEKRCLVDAPIPQALQEALSQGHVKLLDVVRHLGPELTSDDEVRRSRAVVLLALVVLWSCSSPEHSPDRQATTTLAGFFSSKLQDANVVADNIARDLNSKTKPVPGSAPESWRPKYPKGTEMLVASLRALDSLAKLDDGSGNTIRFGSEAAKAAAQAVLEHSDPRAHPQAIRFLVFTLMDSLLSRHRRALRTMGRDFVKGYISLVEGEKDPRNLVYIFAMDRVVMLDWDDIMDSELTEAFFDTTYCYFPITFRPPPDDPYGISTNTLRLSLRKVLIASPLLAPHAMPLLLEKLQASGGNAKRDTLDTLKEALPVFGRAAAKAHESPLWEAFKIEIMHATDDATAICSARALESLLQVLYHEVDPPEGLAPRMIADMLDELEEPSKALAKPAASVMASMIHATPSTAFLATYASLDQLLTAYKDPDEVSTRGPVLDHVSTLLKALRDVYEGVDVLLSSATSEADRRDEARLTFERPETSAKSDNDLDASKTPAESSSAPKRRSYESDKRPLDSFKDTLLATLSHGLVNASTRLQSVDCFVHLTHIRGFLSQAETRHLCDGVNKLLVDANADDVRGQALEALRDLGDRHVIEESTLPLLFGSLPDTLVMEEGRDPRPAVRRSLGALARLCTPADLFDLLVVRLSTKLDLVCAAELKDKEARQVNAGYARGLINTLLVVLEEKVDRKDKDVGRYGSLATNLIGICVSASLRPKAKWSVATDSRVMRDLGALVTLLVRCLDDSRQREMSSILFAAIVQKDLGPLAKVSATLSRSALTDFNPLGDAIQDSKSRAQRNAVHTFAAAIVALRKHVPVPMEGQAETWVESLLGWTMQSQTALQEDAGRSLLVDCVNKHVTEQNGELSGLFDRFWGAYVVGPGARARQRATRVWLSVAKSLVMRGSKLGEEMVNRALSLLSIDVGGEEPESVANEAARGVGEVGSDDVDLCKDNGSVVRLLYKQRYLTFLLPKILASYRDGTSGHYYLVVLASLLPSMPRQTTLDKLQELFPLLILALDVKDARARSSAAKTIALAAAVGRRQKDEAALNPVAAESSLDSASSGTSSPPMSNGSIGTKGKKNALDLVDSNLKAILDRLLSTLATSSVETDDGNEEEEEKVRIAALKCLAIFARTLPYSALHPYKTAVLKTLGTKGVAIDDPRRSVRVAGVDCRDAWFALKEEGANEGS